MEDFVWGLRDFEFITEKHCKSFNLNIGVSYIRFSVTKKSLHCISSWPKKEDDAYDDTLQGIYMSIRFLLKWVLTIS